MMSSNGSDLMCDPHVPSWTCTKISLVTPSPTHFCNNAKYPMRYSSSSIITNLVDCLRIFVASFLSSGSIPLVKYFQNDSLHPVVMLKLHKWCIQGLVLSSWYRLAFDNAFASELITHGIFSICSYLKLQANSFTNSTYFLRVGSRTSYSPFIY